MRLRVSLGLLLAIACGQPAYAQLSGGTLYGPIPGPLSVGATFRSLAPFGPLGLAVANKLGQNTILGSVNNTLAPSTNALPAGVTGYGTVEVGSTGDQAFGAYGLGELYASAGGAMGAEFTARNFSGNSPDVNLPPNTAIGTTTAVPIGENVTCGVQVGTTDCSIGVNIANESGSYSNSAFNTGAYIGLFRQYGLYVQGMTSGNQTSALLANNGTGINLILTTTTAIAPNNGVFQVSDDVAGVHMSIRQNGDTYVNNVVATQAYEDTSYSYSTPTTGTTVTIADTSDFAAIEPAGTLAALTVQLPTCSASFNGKLVSFSSTKTITALTVTATAGTVVDAPTTLAPGVGARYICRGSTAKWYEY